MANITKHRNGEFLRAIFELLWDKEEGVPAKEIMAAIPEKMTLTDFEMGEYPSSPGAPRYHKIARFATIAAVKAGWLLKRKGIWYLTDEGRSAYERLKDPEALYKEADRLYREWKSARPEVGLTEEDLEGEAEEVSAKCHGRNFRSWSRIC